MAQRYREREDKYDVDPDWLFPDLAPALPAGVRLERRTIRLSSRYYDTAGLALLAQRITLRFRTGEADAGWQLKLPDGKARTELRLPEAGEASIPMEFQQLLLGVRSGAELAPVAKIDTERSLVRILDPGGSLLAEIADDQVEAAALGDSVTLSRWREIEVELGAGDEALLSALGRRLRKAGASVARGPSKLARALDQPSGPPVPPRATGPTVGEAVRSYLDAQYAALVAGDLSLRQGESAIHRTRVAARRYRSVLRVFADLFDADAASQLDRELAWYAGLLGEIRDRQVLREHFADAVRAVPERLLLGPVAGTIDQQLLREELAAQRQLTATMAGARYLALLAQLADWQRQPPTVASAHRPAANLAGYLDSAERKLARRLRAVAAAGAADEDLHRARKAAKRARYTAELAAPAVGKPARRSVRRARKLQDVLGEHQDSVLAGELLLRLGAAAGSRPGENGFSYGILHATETARGEVSRRRAAKLGRKA